jgi:hypothetical protein
MARLGLSVDDYQGTGSYFLAAKQLALKMP